MLTIATNRVYHTLNHFSTITTKITSFIN